MEIEHTNRGFAFVKFIDRYGFECSLQKSSLAEEDCIWFGVQENRMHLTQNLVKEILPFLNKFVETGEIY